MTDVPHIDRERQVLLSDIRMDGVEFSVAGFNQQFCVSGLTGPQSLCYAVRGAPIWLEVETTQRNCVRLEPGSIVGLSGLVPHWFKSAPGLSASNAIPIPYLPLEPEASASWKFELLIGHIPMETLAFTNTLAGAVVIPGGSGRIARRIHRAIEGIEDELREPDPTGGAAAIVRRLSETVLLNITRWVVSNTPELAFPLGVMGDARLMRAIAAAAAAPLETWTVERMAHIAGMSRAAFAKRFHELTGDTPLHMLANIRMRMAAEALIRGGGPLEAAAAVAGYGSAAAFIRAFRKVYGLTPAQWRTGHRHASVYAQVGGDGGGGSALDDHT